jgi:hypothetical protein
VRTFSNSLLTWGQKRQTMGGQASIATVHIAFDQSVVQAGHVVTGTVYLSVVQEVLSCASIGYRIVGQQAAAVTCMVSTGGDSYRSTVVERRRFVDAKSSLREIREAVIPRGLYGYPFSFTMPASAPASMYTGESVCYGYIIYTMEVWLDRPGCPPGANGYKACITVAPTPAVLARTPVVMQPRSFDLRYLCLCDRGNVLLGWRTESNVVYAGRATAIKICAENHSKVSLLAVEVTVTEHTKLVAHGVHRTSKRTLYHGIELLEQAGLHLAVSQQQSDPEAALRMAEALNSGNITSTHFCTVRIPIPRYAETSFQNGDTFLVRHELEVKLVTPFGTRDPWLTQELYVVNPAAVPAPPEVLRSEKCNRAPRPSPNWATHVAPRAAFPDVLCDLGALSRPGVNEDRFTPVNSVYNTQVVPFQTSVVGQSDNEQPVGFPYAALAEALRLDASTVSAYQAAQGHNGRTQAVVAPSHPSPAGTSAATAKLVD